MASPVELAIKVSTDTTDAVTGFDKAGQAAKDMAADVSAAGSDVAAAGSKFDTVGGAADGMATKTGTLTGALGALSGGLAAVGLEKYAGVLETTAVATDFASGASDVMALAMDNQAIKTALSTAKTIALNVATKAMAAGQWLLNAAMSANPIGLVVIAVIALIAGLVLLYTKSDRFREIIQKVGEVGKTAVGWVIDKIGVLVGWVRDNLIPKFGDFGSKVSDVVAKVKGWLGDVISKVGDVMGKIGDLIGKVGDFGSKVSDVVGNVKAWFGDVITKVGDVIAKVGDAIDKVQAFGGDAVSGAVGKITAAFDALLGKLSSVWDWIVKIANKLTGGLVGKVIGKVTGSSVAPASSSAFMVPMGRGAAPVTSSTAAAPTVNIVVNGATDPYMTALQIRKLLTRAGYVNGRLTP